MKLLHRSCFRQVPIFSLVSSRKMSLSFNVPAVIIVSACSLSQLNSTTPVMLEQAIEANSSR
jgi:hypothetical protein